MPETTSTPDSGQPDFAAMTRISVTQHWWVDLPDGSALGPYASQEEVGDAFAILQERAAQLGMGVQFAMNANIVTASRYFLESPRVLDRAATDAARDRGGDRR